MVRADLPGCEQVWEMLRDNAWLGRRNRGGWPFVHSVGRGPVNKVGDQGGLDRSHGHGQETAERALEEEGETCCTRQSSARPAEQRQAGRARDGQPEGLLHSSASVGSRRAFEYSLHLKCLSAPFQQMPLGPTAFGEASRTGRDFSACYICTQPCIF